MRDITLEICVGTIEDVKVCSLYPIDRIELTSALELGGLTPSVGMLKQAKTITNIPMTCMVRPHAFGFQYDEFDINVMMEDAQLLLDHGADGIVFGFLNSDNSINTSSTKAMVDLIHSYEKEAVFHKAFDQTNDLEISIQALINCHVDRVLTEGGMFNTQEKKLMTLQTLQQKYSQDIQILVGGRVRSDNVMDIINQTDTQQVHSSCKSIKEVDGLKLVYVDAHKLEDMVNMLQKQ